MSVQNNDIIRITCKFSFQSNDIQNVYHMRVTSGGPIIDATFLSECADEIDAMYDDLVPVIANDVTFETLEMYNLTQDTYIGEVAWPVKTVGGASTDVLPPQNAGLCLFGTSQLRSQGRKFLPPFTETVSGTFGEVTSTALTAMANFIADALVAKAGTAWGGALGNWNNDLSRFSEWISGYAADFFATQRRRYLNRGS